LRAATFLSSSERLRRRRENVTDAALGPDHAWCTRIDLELATQPQYLDVDTVRLGRLSRKWRFNSVLFDADFADTLWSSRNLVSILAQRRVVIDDDDMSNIGKHEFISQSSQLSRGISITTSTDKSLAVFRRTRRPAHW
jgi:hypothetical protein